jgi:hypothetical protein
VKTLFKSLVVVALLALIAFIATLSPVPHVLAQGNYGTYRDTGGGIFSNQGWCNEVTAGLGLVTGCAPDVFSTAYTTTAQAAANVATEQLLIETALPAGALLKKGKTLIVRGAGTYSLGAASTVTIKAKLCTVAGCGSGTVVTPCTWVTASNTNTAVTSPYNFECSIGTSTSATTLSKVLGHGPLSIEVGAAATAAATQFNDVTTAESATIDLTGTIFLDTTVTFGTANASNTMTQQSSVNLLASATY